MSAEKQGTVKSELSADGGLKLTIKREKTVEDVRVPEWVTEARGHGIGKLVIKRKAAGPVCKSPETASVHADRQTEQRPNGPILRLSITSNSSGDGSRHAQVKCWSLCEVPSAVEEVPSVSELSPACQLQSSPKDSGVDMSSPPHDDGAVGVEPNPATGIWTAAECPTNSLPEVETAASCPEKFETNVPGFRADSAVHSDSKTVWPKADSHLCESNRLKVQSTLRSRRERSALRSFSSTSQKLVNPLAKSHRVGRYQHMLPVNRIRAESNVARRSSLEESPTYNMIASRTSLCKPLPRVRTKLKLLSNNTYAPVFDQEPETIDQRAVTTEESKRLNVDKSPSADPEHKTKRRSCKSSKSEAFENMKVNLCYGDNDRDSAEGDRTQKLPKLKLVVKSELAKSVSCSKERKDDASVAEGSKPVEENVPVKRRKRSQREVRKTKTRGECSSEKDGVMVNHLLSSKSEDTRSRRPKRKCLETKQVDDQETLGKKIRLQWHVAEHTVAQVTDSPSQQKSDGHHVEESLLTSEQCKASAEDTAHEVELRVPSVHTDEIDAEVNLCEASDNKLPVVPEKAVAATAAEIRLCELPAESESNSPQASRSGPQASRTSTGDSGIERRLSQDSSFDSEKCTDLNLSDTTADDGKCEVDRQLSRLEDKNVDEAVKEEIWTVDPQNSASDCSSVRNEPVPEVAPCGTDNSSVPSADICTDSGPGKCTPSDQPEVSYLTCAVFVDSRVFGTVEQPLTVCTDANVSLSSQSLVAVDSLAQNTNCTNAGSVLLSDTDSGSITVVQDDEMPSTVKPAGATADDSSCVQNNTGEISSVDSAKLDVDDDDAEHWQDIGHQTIETQASCSENSELKSGSKFCLQNLAGELSDDFTPSNLQPLSPPCCSKDLKETAAAIASSNGFLAAFTQFVQKVGAKRKPATCSITETDSTSMSEEKIMSKSGCSQTSVRQRPFSSHKRRHTSSKKQASPLHPSESESAAVEEMGVLNAEELVEIALNDKMMTAQNSTIDCSSEVAAVSTDKLSMPSTSLCTASKDITSQPVEKITAKSGSRQKSVRQKSSSTNRQRHISSEKHSLFENRIPSCLSQSESTDETVSVKAICLQGTDRLAEVAVKPDMQTAQNSTSDYSSEVAAVSTDKPCRTSNIISADNKVDTLRSAEKKLVTSASSQKSDTKMPFSSHRRQHTNSEKQTLSESRLPCHLSQSESAVETVKETALPEVGSSTLIATKEELLTVQQQNSNSEVECITDKPCVPSSNTCTDSGPDKDVTSQSAEKITATSGSSQKSIRQKSCSADQQRHASSVKQLVSENSILRRLYRSESRVETVSVNETALPETGSTALIATKEELLTVLQQNSNSEVEHITLKPYVPSSNTCTDSGLDIDITTQSAEKITAKSGSSQKSVRQTPSSANRQRHTSSVKQLVSENLPRRLYRSESRVETASVKDMSLLQTGKLTEISVTEGTTATAQRRNSSDEMAAAVTDKPCTSSTSTCTDSVQDKDIISQSADKTIVKSSSGLKSVRHKPFSHIRRHTHSEKRYRSESRLSRHLSESKSTVETESNLPDMDRLAEIASSERLACTTAVEQRPLLSKDELLSIVSADCRLIALRHRVCELIETVFPELQFPQGFRRDSASVERFVKDITDVLSNSGTDTWDVQCTDPVVSLHRMPDRCLQSLQWQVIRLLSLILPGTDLSDLSVNSLDVFLELVTSMNCPHSRSFSVPHPSSCQEASPWISDTFHIHRQPLSPCVPDTATKHEPVDTVGTESHLSAGDALFGIPNSLIQIGSPGPVGDKRSIRRQVKDCLMLLDRDLT